MKQTCSNAVLVVGGAISDVAGPLNHLTKEVGLNNAESLESDSTLQDEQSSINSYASDSQISKGATSWELLADVNDSSHPGPTRFPEIRSGALTSFKALRATYLLITLVIMLADGLQGTHLYVLYEGYGFSVASLYCLGFASGALSTPITGPLVDKLGRKKSAILYCLLEIFINLLEQYPFLSGLIASRMIGGITTNLLSSVFEAWLDTEYRQRGFAKEKYEIIMRDSVIVSNLAAIGSGCIAHVLADHYGAVGPFRGAVTCTAMALAVVVIAWSENYGSVDEEAVGKNMATYLQEAIAAFKNDSKLLRVGIIQGLSTGALQIFVFLWAPALRRLAQTATTGSWGIDRDGEPAYGLIFGSYMGAGVLGGLLAPFLRRLCSSFLRRDEAEAFEGVDSIEIINSRSLSHTAVDLLTASCYFLSALLLAVPCGLYVGSSRAFSICLFAFLLFEIVIGAALPCEGVIRSVYFPPTARASIMTLPRIIVNIAVCLGVLSTNYVTMESAFMFMSLLMIVCAVLQLSLVTRCDLAAFMSLFDSNAWTVEQNVISGREGDGLPVPPALRKTSTFSTFADSFENGILSPEFVHMGKSKRD